MDQETLEEHLKKYRYHLTRSLVELPQFSSEEKIKTNFKDFLRRLHVEYKRAQKILISDYLEIESEIRTLDDAREINRRQLWIAIIEISFNALVWIANCWDRDLIKRVFKGPKHGTLDSRNATSAVTAIEFMNTRWNDFAIALDFCRFECMTDVQKMHIHPKRLSLETYFIEVKEGKANVDMLQTIRSRSKDSYFDYFERYGEHGIKQMKRHFRQTQAASQRLEVMKSETGGHFKIGDEQLFIHLAKEPRVHHVNGVRNLLDHLKTHHWGSFLVDGCLWVCGARVENSRDINAADFFIRHQIHHIVSNDCQVCAGRDGWMQALAGIKLLDGWKYLFAYVVLEPFIQRPISDQEMLDILFGRVRFWFYLHGDPFIRLCRDLGLEAGYTTTRVFNRERSKGHREMIGFEGRALWMKASQLTTYLSEGLLLDICLNWAHPSWWIKEHVHEGTMDFERMVDESNDD
jgi:hypothetical protein